jgi:hypothetical protein
LTERQSAGGLPPSAPATLAVTITNGKPVLTWDMLMGAGWNSSTTDGTGFFVERSLDGGQTYTLVNSTALSPATTTYTDTATAASLKTTTSPVNWMYRVYANKTLTNGSTNTVARSAYSNPAPIVARYVKFVPFTTTQQLNGGNINLTNFQVTQKTATGGTATATISAVYNYSDSTNKYTKNTSKTPSMTFASPWISANGRPANTQQSLYVDLGSPLALSGATATFATGSKNYFAPEYYIYVSPDAVNWTKVYGTIFGTTGTNTVTFTNY